jgi:hypothetical protein
VSGNGRDCGQDHVNHSISTGEASLVAQVGRYQHGKAMRLFAHSLWCFRLRFFVPSGFPSSGFVFLCQKRRGSPWCGMREGTPWTRCSMVARWGSSRTPWRSPLPASCSCSTPSTATCTGSSCPYPDVSNLCFQPPRVLFTFG